MNAPTESLRLDKWLWHARFFKTRSLAARQVSAGKIRVNSVKVAKPARNVSPGDVLTFPTGDVIRVIRIVALGVRRGPAPEAQALYEDLTPPENKAATPPLERGGPRPTKKQRRRLINSRSDLLD